MVALCHDTALNDDIVSWTKAKSMFRFGMKAMQNE